MLGLTLLIVLATGADLDLIQAAEAAFHAGVEQRDDPVSARAHFRASADLWEQARQQGLANPALCRNQGNACLLADDLPGAILAYRRGLWLAPNDSELQQLLAHARSQVVYPASAGAFAHPPVDHRPPWLPRFSIQWPLVLAALAYALAWFALTRWRMVRRSGFLTLSLTAFLVSALLAAIVVLEEVRNRANEVSPLVVIAQDGVHLRKGNGESYPIRYETALNRGVEARLLVERSGWVQVQLAGGETGWLPSGQVRIDRAE
jgi:hypothetical protein